MRAVWRHQNQLARQLSRTTQLIARPVSTASSVKNSRGSLKFLSTSCRRCESTQSAERSSQDAKDAYIAHEKALRLPLSCPGCGAPSQIVEEREAGYYDLNRPMVKRFLKLDPLDDEAGLVDDVLKQVDEKVIASLGLKNKIKAAIPHEQLSTPTCDRCHNLLHHRGGISTDTPVLHPTIESIRSMIEASPHTENHIYHIIDAADFPMSVIPNLASALKLPRLRTKNRRSKDKRFIRGRVADVSFIITRSDLLAPRKEQVDRMMPYLRETLRSVLGRQAENVRLGNVRCVSGRRGWWMPDVKEDVWNRGGAGWMVGKVNVGKSCFFEGVYPKGRGAQAPSLHQLRDQERKTKSAISLEEMSTSGEERLKIQDTEQQTTSAVPTVADGKEHPSELNSYKPLDHATTTRSAHNSTSTTTDRESNNEDEDEEDLDFDSLLPPAQTETQYPVMPIISSLPGTTASPIRVPFGNGKGELIDLPGIARSNLDQFVVPEHRDELVMKTRVKAKQYTIKRGQSLLLGGGLIRISVPEEHVSGQNMMVLAYPFVPLTPHITATAKAEAMESGEREVHIDSIVSEDLRGPEGKLKSAGKFKLRWDVTRERTGPLTYPNNPNRKNIRPEDLPFWVLSADVLIEGVGWVELVAQVRKLKKKHVAEAIPKSDENEPMSTFTPASLEAPAETPSTLAQSTTAEASSQPEDQTTTTATFKPVPDANAPDEDDFPVVEIFSPKGKYVAIRPPMGAWLLGEGNRARRAHKERPRKSMKSLKGSKAGRAKQSNSAQVS